MAEDPAEYRWNSYGEAIGGGRRERCREEGTRGIGASDHFGYGYRI